MHIAKQYDPSQVEDKWYRHWTGRGYFRSVPDGRPPYTIVIPPPNVTGVLHMGHMLNNTIQDVLVRRARLMGFNACWVPGTDHASIATEAKVVAKLKEQGIDKKDLTREQFLEHAWDWTHKHGGIILEQLKKLGASCDWERTAFTMNDALSGAVRDVFIDLYRKGHIYRGARMVNWDPQGLTAISDDEVNYREVASKMTYIRYEVVDQESSPPVKGGWPQAGGVNSPSSSFEGGEPSAEGSSPPGAEYLVIATVRPETIMADTAVCIHPDDPRYAHLKGKFARIPLIDRDIPIIEDEYVSMDFGTGCLKVTPAHDPNDYEIGLRHKLPVIDILNDNGTLNEKAQICVGMDRFAARREVVRLLEEAGHLMKQEDYRSNVGFSERTDAVIEPRLSTQWFLRMDTITKPALDNVLNGNIQLVPDKFINTYRHWMENVRDWCISRQLWWGHRIPAWYNEAGDYVVAKTVEEALQAFAKQGITVSLEALRQDEDALDTWFSSWLWPISVFDTDVFRGEAPNADLKYYYPTAILVTAPEILFFWVARMIIAGYEYMGEKPFSHVYLHGIVRDRQGRKMSKSLGNSPDPLDLIAQYGADGVRMGMLFSSPAGNDLLFEEKLCEQGRNFANKLWNAMRLVKGWEVMEGENSDNAPALAWFEARLNQTIRQVDLGFEQYALSEVLKTLYSFAWDDFCAWLLEMVKPEFGKPIDRQTYDRVIAFFENLLRLLNPFVPFLTEELWHLLRDRAEGDDLAINQWPKAGEVDTKALQLGEAAREVITKVRDIRNQNQLKPKEPVGLFVVSGNGQQYDPFRPILLRLAGLHTFAATEEQPENAITFVANKDRFFVTAEVAVDAAAEHERLVKEIEYTRGFMASVQAKLSNARFVDHAPEAVVSKERQKLDDAAQKLEGLEEALGRLG